MLILEHFLGILCFSAVFLLGMTMARSDRRLAGALLHRAEPPRGACRFFHLSGRFLQLVAAVGAFLDAVAILVLAAGWLSELIMGL